MSKEKSNWFIGICGVITTAFVLIVFIGWLRYIDISLWLARENYNSMGEWFKQLGLFIASMEGFYLLIKQFGQWTAYLPNIRRKKICQQIPRLDKE